MTAITVATEDALSEAVAEVLVAELGGALHIVQRLGRRGFGYLRSRITNFCDMARLQPVVLITDLDQQPCADALIQDWLGPRERPAHMLIRVAVREIESWVLADHDAMKVLLQKPQLRLPPMPDTLADPKSTLIELARRGPRTVREAIVPERGSLSSQGLGYNDILVRHVSSRWSPARAAERSDSLNRTRRRIRQLADALC